MARGIGVEAGRLPADGDIVVGVIGGLFFTLIVPVDQRSGLVGTIVVAVIGAAVFVGMARVLTWRTGGCVGVVQLWSSDLSLIVAALVGLALTSVAIFRDLGAPRLRPADGQAES